MFRVLFRFDYFEREKNFPYLNENEMSNLDFQIVSKEIFCQRQKALKGERERERGGERKREGERERVRERG